MPDLTFERIRIPAALALLAIAAFVFWPRGDGEGTEPSPSPTASVVIGEPGGEILSTATPEAVATPIPTLAPVATPTAAATPAPTPDPADGFGAEVFACRSISGSACNDQLGTLPASAGSFTALVRFTAAAAGDTMNAVLSGPSGTVDGFPYTLEGSGDGYYYTTFTVGSLPGGAYTLTATRNGQPVATTAFRIAGG